MNKILHYVILLLVLNCSLTIKAQWQNGLWTEKQAYNWYFGDYAGLTFNTSPPSVIEDSEISSFGTGSMFIEGTGSISNKEGNTLFYTNGQVIWNANNVIMQNGEGLLGEESSFQNGLIVPDPGNENLYYIFTLNGLETGLSYSKVDMSLDGGFGAVTEKNIQLSTDVEERISAVHHADGKQIWVVTNARYSNEKRAYLISEEGISTEPVTTNIGVDSAAASVMGAMKFSPDGTKLALTEGAWWPTSVEIFNFDKATGKITDLIATLQDSDYPEEFAGTLGLEFSPDSRFLYVSGYATGTVRQLDTEAGSESDIKNSAIIVGMATLTSHWSMQLGPDGKIYLAHGVDTVDNSQTTLNVINFPNNAGLACGFVENAVDLIEGKNSMSMPVFIQSYFASGILHEGSCPNQDVTFTTLRIPDITSISWDFGDPDSGAANISSEPVHAFSNPGTYTVTATITSNGAVQTATTEIIIIERPKAVSPATELLVQCADANAIFNLSAFNGIILDGQDTDIFSVVYFATEEDRIANNPIANIMEFTTAGQTIYAVVTNSETGCHTILPLNLVVLPLPIIGSADNMELCGDMSAIFDLTLQTSTLLSGQDPNEFSVVYYTDENLTNEIQQPEQFESEGQIIYATVINNATGCTALAVREFDIIVLPLPTLPETTSFQGCSPFDLISLVGTPVEGTTYSFYNTEEDAIEGVNSIPAAENYIVENNTGSVYIRALNNMGCVQVSELFLEEGDCFIPRGISPNNDGKNDSFNLSGFGVEQITIFNRYGKEVYSQANYSNEWIGQDSKGNELPTATYYYMIKLNTGESKTGWVYINRQN